MVVPASAQAQLASAGADCQYFMGVSIFNQFIPAAQACAGAFAGNDRHYHAEIAALINANGWGSGTYLGTTDAGSSSGPFSSVDGGKSGVIVFDSPLTGDYVFVMKAANQFSLYYFTGLVGATELSYVTSGIALNNNGKPQGLSHVSLWGNPPVRVPEPNTGLLLATAMMGFLGATRRRRNQQT
jgi:hypothetical protein